MKTPVTKLLRLTFEEMLHLEVLANIAIESATKDTHRLKVVRSAHQKVKAALDEAVRDGLLDPDSIKI